MKKNLVMVKCIFALIISVTAMAQPASPPADAIFNAISTLRTLIQRKDIVSLKRLAAIRAMQSLAIVARDFSQEDLERKMPNTDTPYADLMRPAAIYLRDLAVDSRQLPPSLIADGVLSDLISDCPGLRSYFPDPASIENEGIRYRLARAAFDLDQALRLNKRRIRR
ncbi:MAG: hypothetical protein HY537_00615 [Deltaproteobacteria bacterium]|nr:hypothetical protein [Deltaproteobacteria bacterium]